MAGCYSVRATAWSTSNLASEQRITVVPLNAAITIVATGKVRTLNTFASLGVASSSMSVTVTGLAIGEVPVSNLALIAFSTVGLWMTIALSCDEIALVVLRSHTITIASLTSIGREAVSSRRTFIALTPDDVGFAFAMTAVLFAFFTERPSWVAVAS